MLYRWLLSLSIISLSAGILLLAFVSRKPICIESSVVKKIDRSNAAETIFNCDFRRHISYDERAILLASQIEKRLSSTTQYLEWLAPFSGKVAIYVAYDQPHQFSVEQDTVVIGSELVDTEHLERALIKFWLTQRHASSLLNLVGAESIVDLIQYASQGKLEMKDPLTGGVTDLSFHYSQTRLAKTGLGYCESSWKRSEDIEICSTALSRSDLETQRRLYRLRPLLSQILIRSFDEASADDKVSVVRRMALELPLFLTRSLYSKDIVDGVQTPLLMTAPDFLEILEKHVSNRGLEVGSREVDLDVLVMADDIDVQSGLDYQMESLSHRFPKKVIGTLFEGAVRVQPLNESVRWQDGYKIKSKQIVYLSCASPTKERMNWLSQIGQRLLLVKSCGADSSGIKWESFFRRGLAGFSLQNPDVSFVSFHLPSYILAHRHYGARKDVLNLESYKKTATYDTNINAYRPLTNISVIDAFRSL